MRQHLVGADTSLTKYVLWDDVLDWERDIKDYGKKKKEIKGQRRLI